MKALSGLLAYLCSILALVGIAFVAIAITTDTSLRFWEGSRVAPEIIQIISTVESTPQPLVEVNFVFCLEPPDDSDLNADTCEPATIRSDSKVYIQLSNGSPIVVDGFPDLRTGFKVRIDRGDTVIAVSIENPYLDTKTFGESALGLKEVSGPRTVYLPL